MTRSGARCAAALALLVATGLGPAAGAGDIEGTLEVASIWPDGQPAWVRGDYDMSDQGRFVVFPSAGNLYRRDLRDGETKELSLAPRFDPRTTVMSPRGRFVAFLDTEVVGASGDTRLIATIYLHDVRRNATHEVLRVSDGVGGAHLSEGPVLAAGIRYVAFATRDPDFAPHDTNERRDVFVLDRRSGEVELVSATRRGRPGNGLSGGPALTADGRTVVFASSASNLVPGDTNGVADIFLRDLDTGVTRRVNVTDEGAQATGSAQWATISGDGSVVAFAAPASSLDPAATDHGFEIFVRDLAAGTTTRLAPGTADGTSLAPVLSEHGRYVAYNSTRPDITDTPHCNDTAHYVYLHDRRDGTTTCLTPYLDPGTAGSSHGARITSGGAAVAFFSDSVLVPDAGREGYVYRWHRTRAE